MRTIHENSCVVTTLIQPMGGAAVSTPQAELRVCPNGCPYTVIQDAIDATEPGDSTEAPP
ncbi:MAG: hypothetical protein GXY37_01290 [Chloroflexi bacterium]|nr:hypothetical protein [Chloroflexota bacterium]